MADTKASDETAASALGDADGWAGVQGGVDVFMTVAQMKAAVAAVVLAFNTQTASYALVLADGDGNTQVLMNVAGANNLTVPPHSSVAIPVGRTVLFAQMGAGTTTIVAGGGVTLHTASSLTTRAQYSTGGMTQIATDVWLVFGDMT